MDAFTHISKGDWDSTVVYRTTLLIECSNWLGGTTVSILTFTERVAAVLNYTNSPCRIYKKTRRSTNSDRRNKNRENSPPSLRTNYLCNENFFTSTPYQENWTELKKTTVSKIAWLLFTSFQSFWNKYGYRVTTSPSVHKGHPIIFSKTQKLNQWCWHRIRSDISGKQKT